LSASDWLHALGIRTAYSLARYVEAGAVCARVVVSAVLVVVADLVVVTVVEVSVAPVVVTVLDALFGVPPGGRSTAVAPPASARTTATPAIASVVRGEPRLED
jgi:hypothetical protein